MELHTVQNDLSLPNYIWLPGVRAENQPGLVLLGWLGLLTVLWTKPINVIVRRKNFKQRENH